MNAPQQIGGFVLERELGRGGMGVVYLARDPRVGRPVALKVILGDPSPEALRRFQAEARAAGQLDHSNVVRVLSAGEDQGRPFLALEFVEGETLSERLKRQGTLDPKLAAKLIGELARGVAHAHERGVIHRDIKPDNVLLVGETPRLTDFGLARLGERQHTQTGAVMGTPAYMAPEQAAGEAARVGPHSDVYGLGALLYRCLSGRPPFLANSAITILRKVINDPPEPLPGIPAPLQTVLEQCLDKVPERRPSAAQLAWQLEGFLHEASAPVGGAVPRRSAAAAGPGPRWPLVVCACSLLAAAGVAGWALLRGQSESAPVKPPPPVVDGLREDRDAEATRELARRVAAARDAYRWDEADGLLAEARETHGKLPPELAFEAAYLQVLRCHCESAIEPLQQLTRRCDGLLAARVQALLALANANEMRWAESEIAEGVALAGHGEDWLVLRLLAHASLARFYLKLDAESRVVAEDRLARAVTAGDEDPSTRAVLASFRAASLPGPERRTALERAVEEAPCPQAFLGLAHNLCQVDPRRWDAGFALAEQAVAAAPQDPLTLESAGGAYVSWLQFHQGYNPPVFDLAKVARAEELVEQALALAPDDPSRIYGFAYRWRLLGEARRAAGDAEGARAHWVRAREILTAALGRYAGSVPLRRELAECLNHLEGPLQAVHVLDPLLRSAGAEDAVLHHLKSKYLAGAKDFEGALASAREASRLAPEREDFVGIVCRMLVAVGRVDEAIEGWRAGVSRAPDFPNHHADLITALLKAQRGREALDALDDAVRRFPKRDDFRQLRERLAAQLGRGR